MATYVTYNTGNPSQPAIPVSVKTVIGGPFESGIAKSIVFSFVSDQPGTLYIYQSFESPYYYTDEYGNISSDSSGRVGYFLGSGGFPNSDGQQHWDIVDEVSISANAALTSSAAQYSAIGSYVMFLFDNTTEADGSPAANIRFHARVYGIDRG